MLALTNSKLLNFYKTHFLIFSSEKKKWRKQLSCRDNMKIK